MTQAKCQTAYVSGVFMVQMNRACRILNKKVVNTRNMPRVGSRSDSSWPLHSLKMRAFQVGLVRWPNLLQDLKDKLNTVWRSTACTEFDLSIAFSDLQPVPTQLTSFYLWIPTCVSTPFWFIKALMIYSMANEFAARLCVKHLLISRWKLVA